ncbi:MAG: hypothetical protein U0441_22580 [Polyangiaceae bacterium]
MKRAVLCLALTACTNIAPAAPSRSTPAVPGKTPSAKSAPSATGSAALRPAPISVEKGTVIGHDAKGKELFRGVFSVDESSVRFEVAGSPERSFRLPLRRFPGALGESKRVFAVGNDGVALAGASDGSLIAVDWEGTPRYQLGVRGPVKRITTRPSGGYVVSTDAGDVILDGASTAPIEPAPRTPAPITFVARPTPDERAPLIVLAPDDAWTIEEDTTRMLPIQTLHHFDGETWTEVRMEALEATKSVRLGSKDFVATNLARGPKGQLLVLGYERGWSALGPDIGSYELRVFERAAGAFRLRSDIAPAFRKTYLTNVFTTPGEVSYAVGPGGREIVCLMERCLAHGLPASFRPPGGKPPVSTPAAGWSFFEWADGGRMENRAMIWAGDSLFRIDFDGFTRDGKELLDTKTVYSDITDGKYPPPPDPWGSASEGRYDDQPTRGLWASGPEDVWVSVGWAGDSSAIFRWNGKETVNLPCPLKWVDQIWGFGPEDVWFSGEGVAHYDGHEIRRIPGIPAGKMVAGGPGEVWIGTFRLLRASATLPDLEGTPAPAPPFSQPSAPVDVSAAGSSLHMEDAKVKIPGQEPLAWALGASEGPGGLVWLHDLSRLVEVDGAGARVLYRASSGEQLDGAEGAAPRSSGEGVFVATGPDGFSTLRTVTKGHVDDIISWPGLSAVVPLPNGEAWVASATDVKAIAGALSLTATGLRNVAGLSEAAYASVAARATDDVWLAGGLTTAHEEVRPRPAGEGILVHFDGRAFTRYRGPDGALLSVVAVGPAEAWAVGYDGGVVHVKGGVATAYHLERDKKPLRVPLRAVAATGPSDVWIVGEGSTVLRWDGKAFLRMDVASVGAGAALSAVVPPRDKVPGWLAGPRGIWRFTRTE